MFPRKKNNLERNKNDDKIIECVLSGDAAKLRPLVEKKKYSSLLAADRLGRTPIFEACRLGFTECAEILLNAEPEANVLDEEGRNPLHISAIKGHSDCVTLLLKKGMPADSADKRGQTALHLAASNGSHDVLQALIAFSADTEKLDRDGNTALLCAAKNNQRQAAIALMNASANVNAMNRQQKTALMFACESGAKDVVQMLLQRGAQVGAKDTGGRTALSYAKMNGHKNVEDMLPPDAPLGRLSMSAGGGTPVEPTSGPPQDFSELTALPPSNRRGSMSGGQSISQMREQVESLQTQLAKANEEKQAFKSEADALRAQLAEFEPDEGDVTFDDDTIDLGHDPSSPRKISPEQEIKYLKQKIMHQSQENAELSKRLEEAEESSRALQEKAAADGDTQALKKEIADLKEQISDLSGGMPMVPMVVLNQLRADHEAQIAKIKAEGGGGAAAAAAAASSDGGDDAARCELYRQALLAAYTGTLSNEMKAALDDVLGLEDDE